MNSSFFNYKALTKGGIISTALAVVLYTDPKFSIVNPEYASRSLSVFLSIILFALCWLFVTFLANKFPLYKLLGVLGILVIAMLAERLITIQNNPITIPAIILEHV